MTSNDIEHIISERLSTIKKGSLSKAYSDAKNVTEMKNYSDESDKNVSSSDSTLSEFSDMKKKRKGSPRPYFKSKCCKKCRRRREKRLERKLRSRSWSRRRKRSDSWENFRGSRSPSIPLDPNRTSPSHLEARRITSARKLPIPYNRRWSSSEESDYSAENSPRYKRSSKREAYPRRAAAFVH